MVNVALLANAEPATTVWFAFRIGPSTFGVFDAFSDDAGRQAYLAGQIAAALMVKAPELLAPAADHRASRRARREAAIERVDGRHRQMLASRSTHH